MTLNTAAAGAPDQHQADQAEGADQGRPEGGGLTAAEGAELAKEITDMMFANRDQWGDPDG